MIDQNKLVVAFNDKGNKAVFNQMLADAFQELGGAENDALSQLLGILTDAGIKLNTEPKKCRASLIGKLGVMGLKKIVKPKPAAKKKDPNEPTKKDLIADFLKLTGIGIDELTTLPNLKKSDIKTLIDCYTSILEEV